MSKLEELKKLINEGMDIEEKNGNTSFIDINVDYQKCFDKGNKTAGVRLRKVLQKIKEVAQEIRVESK